MEKLRNSDADTASESNSVWRKEVIDESTTEVIVQDKLFVAVDKEVKGSKSTLQWALHSSAGKKICILHVHQPAQTISIMGAKFPVSTLREPEVRAHREMERQEMNKVLGEYLRICARAGVQAEKAYIDNVSVEKGIIELIHQLRIGKLVMGAAPDRKYSRKMIEPKSKKAIYVRKHAPAFCHIWFICKGHLIYTREGIKTSNSNHGGKCLAMLNPLQYPSGGCSTSKIWVDSERIFDGPDRSLKSKSFTDSSFSSIKRIGDDGNETELLALPQPEEMCCSTSDPRAGLESSTNHMLYEQLEKAKADAENSRREALEESIRCQKAERALIDSIHKEKSNETLYLEELKRRREVEEELAREKEELEDTKNQQDMVLEELRVALDQKSALEIRVEKMVKNLEEKMVYVCRNVAELHTGNTSSPSLESGTSVISLCMITCTDSLYLCFNFMWKLIKMIESYLCPECDL